MREDLIKSASIYILHKSRFTNATVNLMRAQHVNGSSAVVLKIRQKTVPPDHLCYNQIKI